MHADTILQNDSPGQEGRFLRHRPLAVSCDETRRRANEHRFYALFGAVDREGDYSHGPGLDKHIINCIMPLTMRKCGHLFF